MTFLIGIDNILIGLAYSGMGLQSLLETIALHRHRGWSRFGLGFSLMAASCGPHHLIHGWHVLHGEPATGTMLAATLIGLPAGISFIWLRLETLLGGRGDRTFAMSTTAAVVAITAFALAAGWIASSSIAYPPVATAWISCTTSSLALQVTSFLGCDLTSFILVTNLFVTATYGMVGWYLADTQARRHATTGNWSLSGLSLVGIFLTCALLHLVHAFTTDGATLVFDLLGVPASIYYLWIVGRLHNDLVVDWNRRPLVGVSTAPERTSPWNSVQI